MLYIKSIVLFARFGRISPWRMIARDLMFNASLIRNSDTKKYLSFLLYGPFFLG